MTRVFVPRDSGALAVGAEQVAQAIAREAQARNIPIEIVRTGSRGLYWLEPMIVVETAVGRIAYGPIDGRRCCLRCSTPTCWQAGRIPSGSARPSASPFWHARPGSRSRAAGSSIRARSRTIGPTAAIAASSKHWRSAPPASSTL